MTCELLRVSRLDLSQHHHRNSHAEMHEPGSVAVTAGSRHTEGLIQWMSFLRLLRQTQHRVSILLRFWKPEVQSQGVRGRWSPLKELDVNTVLSSCTK